MNNSTCGYCAKSPCWNRDWIPSLQQSWQVNSWLPLGMSLPAFPWILAGTGMCRPTPSPCISCQKMPRIQKLHHSSCFGFLLTFPEEMGNLFPGTPERAGAKILSPSIRCKHILSGWVFGWPLLLQAGTGMWNLDDPLAWLQKMIDNCSNYALPSFALCNALSISKPSLL